MTLIDEWKEFAANASKGFGISVPAETIDLWAAECSGIQEKTGKANPAFAHLHERMKGFQK